MSDKDTNSQGKTPNDNLPFFRRFMKNYVLPERKLYLGSSDNNTDDLRQIEKDLQILKKARLRAHYVCAPDIIQFDECSLRDGSFIGLYTCRRAMKQMNQCLIDVAADRQVIDDCKEEYLRERNFYRAHGTPLKDINREERQVKFWIDKGKKDYSEAKQKFEQTGEAFDWRKLCHDSKFLPK